MSFSWGPFTLGPQSDTYEPFYGEPDDPVHSFFDFGLSRGQAQAYIVGYHANASISVYGIFCDVIQYVRENRN